MVAANIFKYGRLLGLFHHVVEDDSQGLVFIKQAILLSHLLQPGDVVVIEFKLLLCLSSPHNSPLSVS